MPALIENLQAGYILSEYKNGDEFIGSILKIDLPPNFNTKGYTIQKRRDPQGKELADEIPLYIVVQQDKFVVKNLYPNKIQSGFQEIPYEHIGNLAITNGLMGGLIQGIWGDGISIRYFDPKDKIDTSWKNGLLIPTQ